MHDELSEWTNFLDFRATTYLSNASCDRCILVQWSCAICLKSWINTWNDNILVSFRGGQSSQASWTSDAKAASILCEVALRPRTPWNQRLVRPASDLPSDNETVCHGKWQFSLDDTFFSSINAKFSMAMLNSERVVFENCSLFSWTRFQDDSGAYSPVNWRLRLGLWEVSTHPCGAIGLEGRRKGDTDHWQRRLAVDSVDCTYWKATESLNCLNLSNHLLRTPECFWCAWGNMVKHNEMFVDLCSAPRTGCAMRFSAMISQDRDNVLQPWSSWPGTLSAFSFSQAKLHSWWPTCGLELSAADMFFARSECSWLLAPQAGTEQHLAALAGRSIFFSAVLVHPIDKGYDWCTYARVYAIVPIVPIVLQYTTVLCTLLNCSAATPQVASWSPDFWSQLYVL